MSLLPLQTPPAKVGGATRRQFVRTALLGGALTCVSGSLLKLEGQPAHAGVIPGETPEMERAKGQAILDSLPTNLPRYDGTVAVWFSSHYQVDPRDWKNIQEFGNAYHPLAGYYKSDDPAVLSQQLHWMRRAGIDAIVYDVFSTGVWSLRDLPKDRTLKLLLKALSDPTNEASHFKLIIWLEKYVGMPTTDDYIYALDYIREYLAPQDFYFRYQGKPLVVPYLNVILGDLDDTFEKYRSELAIRYIRAFKSEFWSYIEHSPQQVRKGWMCASPGMDAYLEDAHLSRHVRHETSPPLETIRSQAQHMARRAGATFVEQLNWAKQNHPEIIFVSGWNDWQYGCQIEPSVEYRFLYLDLNAKVLGRWQETEKFRNE